MLFQIKCKHEYQFIRSRFINGGMTKLSIYGCPKCGKRIVRDCCKPL